MENVVFDLAWVGAVIAFFLPLVTSFLKRSDWSKSTKQVLALAVAVVAAVVNVGLQAGWDFSNAQEFLQLSAFSISTIWVQAQVAYRHLWQDTAVETKLESVGSGAAA